MKIKLVSNECHLIKFSPDFKTRKLSAEKTWVNLKTKSLGWVAQSVAWRAHDLGVLGSIPGRVELLSGNKKCHSPLIHRSCEYVVSDMEMSSVSTGVKKLGNLGRFADRRKMSIAVKKRR